MSQSKITADHDLVKAKVAAGLPLADALIVAQRQLDHDAALAANEKAVSAPAEPAAPAKPAKK
jgi:hypothetical protein